jgi:hypothetical protein
MPRPAGAPFMEAICWAPADGFIIEDEICEAGERGGIEVFAGALVEVAWKPCGAYPLAAVASWATIGGAVSGDSARVGRRGRDAGMAGLHMASNGPARWPGWRVAPKPGPLCHAVLET